ncbi:transporter substrate-binding domain-containing protein [Cupriavidus sp. RAF12]
MQRGSRLFTGAGLVVCRLLMGILALGMPSAFSAPPSPAPAPSSATTPAAAQGTSSAKAPAALAKGDPSKRQLGLAVQPWKGDFDAMMQRRLIRVLVPYSRSLYFLEKGHERGLTAELVRDFERYLNKTYADRLGKRPVTVYLIPTTRDRMLSDLNAGLGDIAAGNLTVTAEREKQVDFLAPRDRKPVKELVITGPKAEPIASLDALAGRTIHVRKSSSYYESLNLLDRRLRDAGKPGLKLVMLPDALEDEDAMEMLNAGLIDVIVVDDWKARLWALVLPKIKIHDDLVLRAEGYVGWATRKGSPQLHAAIDDFYKNFLKKQGVAEYRLSQYMKRFKQIRNNGGDEEVKRFQATVALFEKYGAQYGFDPLMLAAQGFQESQLDQKRKSRVGAVGIMQLMPATGKEMGVGSIAVAEANIHAGAKYMDQLMTRYFADAHFEGSTRTLFAFASYNAGPGNISKMRKLATERGLNPDKWFNNVEIVVAEKIGMETTTYVRNIYKYYAAYTLLKEAQARREKAVEQVVK